MALSLYKVSTLKKKKSQHLRQYKFMSAIVKGPLKQGGERMPSTQKKPYSKVGICIVRL